jgi:hypothetical protein
VELPLKPILEKLPPDLRAKVTMPLENLNEASISIPASQILPQLATGIVRIEFGQLRRAAASLFDVGADFDSIAITLPLDLVLSRLNRRLLARDAGQKKLDAPKDIGSVFLRRSDVAPPPAAPPKPPAPAPAPAPTQDTQIRLKMSSGAPSAPAPAPQTIAPTPAPAPFTVPPIAPRRETPVIPSAAPAPAPAPVAVDSDPHNLTVPLIALTEKWPDALRNEIVQRNLISAKVSLPMGSLEEGMKRGIVTMYWRDVRGCIRPNPVTEVSVHDGAALELPLKVIAPIFVAKQAPHARPRANVQFDKSIPNVFISSLAPQVEPPPPAPEPVSPPPAAPPALKMSPSAPIAPVSPISPISTPAPVAVPTTTAPPADAGTQFTPLSGAQGTQGTDVIRRRAATPADVIRRTMELKGIEGVMIVLHDGLMVASELPPYLDADTAAAFLPQIYDRLSQCIGELRMGPLSHLRFNVGSASWLVFRQTSVYFAVFGRQGELPPEPQLAALAAELDRNRQ